MKSAYDRGYEHGLQSVQGVGASPPYHYNKQERNNWLLGWCAAYLDTWGNQ